MPRHRIGFVLLATVALGVTLPSMAQQTDTADPKARSKNQEAKKADRPKAKGRSTTRKEPPGFYMGRRVADVMSYLGADWLVRDTREQEEHPEQMLDALKIPEGATVADVGAGVGYTSLRLARRVGPKGTVYSTDLQPEMIKMLISNAKEAGADRVIKPVLCTPTDQKLPASKLDLAIMVDVYHECSDPVATLQGIKKALKPGGRLVLVEFRGEDPDVPIKPEHKMTLRQVRKELEPQGFAFKDSLEFLPWQHIIIFEKPGETEKAKQGDAAKSEG